MSDLCKCNADLGRVLLGLSGIIGLRGIDGIRVLLKAIPFLSERNINPFILLPSAE